MSTAWAPNGPMGMIATHRICDRCGERKPMYTASGDPMAWIVAGPLPRGWTKEETPNTVRHYCTKCRTPVPEPRGR